MTTLSRRNLTKGAAWTLPVITIAASAPAMAASPAGSEPLMAYYESVDENETSPLSNQPFSPEHPELTLNSIIYAETNGSTDAVTAMQATIYLPVSGLTFTATNGQKAALENGQDAWTLPAGPSGATEVNGTTMYAYVFTWRGNVAPVDSFDYNGETYSLFDYPALPNLHVQVTGGTLSNDMQAQTSLTITTADGRSATRQGPVETVGTLHSPVGDPL